jgi:hypothetical protein
MAVNGRGMIPSTSSSSRQHPRFKVERPPNLGFSNVDAGNLLSIYGGAPRRTDYITLNHSGYFVPQLTGPYEFTAPNCDDIVILWLGEVVNNGTYNRDNADILQTYKTSTKGYSPFLTANQ